MTLFAIWREYPPMTPEEVDSMHFRAAMSTFMVPVRWVRSFVIDQPGLALQSICIYEGDSAKDVSDHAACALMPLSAVEAVVEVRAAGLSHFGPTGESLTLSRTSANQEQSHTPAKWKLRRTFTTASGLSLALYADSGHARHPGFIPVTEGLPAMVANVYDSLGLARYWEL